MAGSGRDLIRKLGYRDYAALPEDGKRYEILDGELYVSAAPVPKHQEVSLNLERILDQHVRSRQLGRIYHAPIDVILDRHTIAQPDILFIARGRESIVTERAIEGAPDLLVEILSPNTARRDRGIKARLYARFGVPHYWLIDPRREVLHMYAAAGDAYGQARSFVGRAVASSRLFPRLRLDLARVWPEPLR